MSVYARASDVPPHVPPERIVDFDIYAPPHIETGFFEAWKQLHAPGIPELIWTSCNGGHWIATRSSLVDDILANHDLFSSRVTVVPKELGEKIHFVPLHVDPPEHRRYRMLLNEGLSAPRTVRNIEPQVRQAVIDLIESFRRHGACDFVSDFAEMMPIRVFLSLVDLPVDDAPRLRFWAGQVVRPDGTMTIDEALSALRGYLLPYIDQRIHADGQDLLSRAINKAPVGRQLSRDEALDVCINVLFAGIDTLVSLFGFMMLFLAQEPTQRRELIDDPSLIPSAVEEFVRRFPVALQGREVRQDVDYAGVSLRQGEMIIVCTQLAGIDEQQHERPMVVDFHRERMEHATFGKGVHLCPGANLARAELRITLEEWLKRIPEFQVDPQARIRFRGGIVGSVGALPLVWNPNATVGLESDDLI